MKKILQVVLILTVCLTVFNFCDAQEVRYPSEKGFVNDYAGVLSPGTRSELEALLSELERKTTAEIAVVTVKTTTPLTIEQYAVGLFQKWGIGKKGEDNGILMLLAIEDRKVRIEVGYGLEGVVTDLQSKIIIQDMMIPAFRQGGYDLGVSSGVVMLVKILRDEYGVQLDMTAVSEQVSSVRGRKRSPLGTLFTLLFFILIFGFRFGSMFFLMSGGGGYWSGGSRGSFGGGFGGFGGGMSGGGGASGSW